MKYVCLKSQTFTSDAYQLTPIRYSDIFLIKQWRNEQIDILRQNIVLTDAMQEAYFANTIQPSFFLQQPRQILFSYLKDGLFIGYGGIVHIDWEKKQGEVSFLSETQRAHNFREYQADFSHFLTLIKKVAFHDLLFSRLYTETFDVRPQHIKILESAGFQLEQRLKNWVTINGKPIDALIHGCMDTQNDELEK